MIYIITIYLILVTLCILMIIRNELVYKHRFKSSRMVVEYLTLHIENRTYTSNLAKAAWATLESPSYNETVFKVLEWDIDKLMNTENRLKELDNEHQ